jgi:multidrug efflux pump
MNLSRPFIDRPVATGLLMVAIVLGGLLAYWLLPVSALPEVDYPTIQVYTRYPGANPKTVSTTITAPLERRFAQMPGLKQMNSTSSDGMSNVTLQFDLALPLDVAEQEVQAAINGAGKILPADLPYPPLYSKINPADAPILTLALHSDDLPLTEVEDLADTRLTQKLSQVVGVGLVSIEGGHKKAIRIEANGKVLAGLNESMEMVRDTISNANQNLAKGTLDIKAQSYAIDSNDQLSSLNDYKNLVLEDKNGSPITLASVAQATHGAETMQQAAWNNGKQIIEIDIRRQPGANVINVVNRIRELLPKLQATLPSSVSVEILTDRTETIRASVKDVQMELVTAVALVVMVIFLFLRNLPATLIPAVSVPVTLIGTLASTYALGFSLNNLSLMALTIATGFVVDDAIVVIENIIRFIEQGDTPIEAAIKGSRQIGFTIISLSVSLIAALIPLLFMEGIVGRLFREFALTLSVAVVVSALVSLTLTPMMCGRMLKSHVKSEQDISWMRRIERAYERQLDWAIRHQVFVMACVLLTIAGTCATLYWMPKGLFPVQDTGLVAGITQASPKISFNAMIEEQQALVADLQKDPDVDGISSFVGIDQNNPTLNTGHLLIKLKSFEQRRTSQDHILRRLMQLAASDSPMKLYLRPIQDLNLDMQNVATEYQVGMQSTDPQLLAQANIQLAKALRADLTFADVFSSAEQMGNQITLNFDRALASRLGIAQQDIDNVLYDSFGERQISIIYTQLNQYRVVLAARDMPRNTEDFMNGIFIKAADGKMTPLSAIATMKIESAPLEVDRQGQFPYSQVAFNLAPGHSLDQAVSQLASIRNSLNLPPGIETYFEGAAQLFQSSLKNSMLLVLAATIVIYILMGILYESLIHPLTILSTLPAAGLGALLALWMSNMNFDVIALIGVVLLIGIVMKNAIMMIDFSLELERKQALSPVAAISRAAAMRFRPIMMTTMASMFGALPLAFGTGIGGELRHPLGIAIIGGLIASQLLTLFSTPVVYLIFNRLALGSRNWHHGARKSARIEKQV